MSKIRSTPMAQRGTALQRMARAVCVPLGSAVLAYLAPACRAPHTRSAFRWRQVGAGRTRLRD